MPTSLEIKRLNNIKHAKLDLENKMAELDPNSEEYANLLIKLNIAIVNFTKKLNICISKKLLTDDDIIKYKHLISPQNIQNRFIIKQLEEKQLEEEHRRIEEERKIIEDHNKKIKKIAHLRRRK